MIERAKRGNNKTALRQASKTLILLQLGRGLPSILILTNDIFISSLLLDNGIEATCRHTRSTFNTFALIDDMNEETRVFL